MMRLSGGMDAEDRKDFDKEGVHRDLKGNQSIGDHLLAHRGEVFPASARIKPDDIGVETVERSADEDTDGGEEQIPRVIAEFFLSQENKTDDHHQVFQEEHVPEEGSGEGIAQLATDEDVLEPNDQEKTQDKDHNPPDLGEHGGLVTQLVDTRGDGGLEDHHGKTHDHRGQ